MTEKELLDRADLIERWIVRLAIAGIIIGLFIEFYRTF